MFPGSAAANIKLHHIISKGQLDLEQASPFEQLQASITPGLQAEQVLLGMSFVQHIEFTQQGDTLILRQYP